MVEFSRYAQLATVSTDGWPTVRTVNIRGPPEELAPPPATAGSQQPLEQHARGVLKFSTDARSSKIAELAASARSSKDGRAVTELCWFFPMSREQFRLRCHATLIFTEGGEEVAAAHFPSSPSGAAASAASSAPLPSGLIRRDPAAQALHLSFWKSHAEESRQLFELARPGTVKKRAETGDLDKFEPQPISADIPSRNFVTVVLSPLRADYLKLPRPADDTRGQITRVQHHESTLQPGRHQSRWLHTLEEQTGTWTATELNP
jgi:hypothetical protein